MKFLGKKDQNSGEIDRTQRTISIIKKLQQNNLGDKTKLENMLIDLEEGLPLDSDAKTYLKSLYEQYKAQRQTRADLAPKQMQETHPVSPRKVEESRIQPEIGVMEIIQYAKKLRAMNIGESWRLDYVINTLERGDPLFSSDMEYIQGMISRYFDVKASNSVSQRTNQVNYIQPPARKNDEFKKKIPNIKSVFTAHAPPKFIDASLLAVRLGLAFVFIWAGMGKIGNPMSTLDMIDDRGLNLIVSADMVTMFGMLEIVAALMILAGAATRIGAAIHLGILIWIQFIFGFSYLVGPSLWKDIAMIGTVGLLIICGSGRFGIDSLVKSGKTAKLKDPALLETQHKSHNEMTSINQISHNKNGRSVSRSGRFTRQINQHNSQITHNGFSYGQDLKKRRINAQIDSEKTLFSKMQTIDSSAYECDPNSQIEDAPTEYLHYDTSENGRTSNNVKCDCATDVMEMSNLIKEIKQEKSDMIQTSGCNSAKETKFKLPLQNTSNENIQVRLDAKILEVERLKDALNMLIDDLKAIKNESEDVLAHTSHQPDNE